MSLTILRVPDLVSASRNPIPVYVQADPLWQSKTDYHLKIIIQDEKVFRSGSLTLLSTTRVTPDANGRVTIDLGATLDSLVDHDPPAFPAPIYVTNLAANMVRRYSLSIQEWSNGAITDARNYPMRLIANAGLGHTQQVTYFTYTHNDKKFLTRQPRVKKVTELQPEWLYYMIPIGVSLTNIKAKIEPITTSGVSAVIYSDPVSATIWDVAIFPVGYKQLRLNDDTITGWRVSIQAVGGSSDGLVISEVMEYQLDCECNPLDRYIVFENSLGGYDTIRMRGKADTQMEVTGGQGMKASSPLSWRMARNDFTFGTQHSYASEHATGYMGKEEARWAHDLLRSDDVYRIGDIEPNVFVSGELTPIVRESASWQVLDDENLYRLSYKYKEAIQNTGL